MPSNDPDGRLPARRRGESAEDALTLLRLAHSLTLEAESASDAEAIENVIRDLRRHKDRQLGLGKGHVSARKKYKSRSKHLALESEWQEITIFLDESGKDTPSLEQPIFALAAIALTSDQAREYMESTNSLKNRFGIPSKSSLHGPEVEKGVGDFAFGCDESRRRRFEAELSELLKKQPAVLFGAIIRKPELATLAQYDGDIRLPRTIYDMALTLIGERVVDFLHSEEAGPSRGRLVFESIGSKEDAIHQKLLANLLVHGTEFVTGGCFRGCLSPGCEFLPKCGTHPLELADLASRSMMLWARDGFPTKHQFLDVWGAKIYSRDDCTKGKSGLKVFPDNDIRTQIMLARQSRHEQDPK